MTAESAKQLQPGDEVTHMHNNWDQTQEVESVDSQHFPEDPIVFFVGGGFWRSSRLMKAAD